MSFYDKLDCKKTISKAKTVLEEYARFLKIVKNAFYDVSVGCALGHQGTFSNYVNADTRLIEAINIKDRNYKEIHEYIRDIQSCINCMKMNQIEIINMKYVDNLCNAEIAKRLTSEGKIISERQVNRRFKDIYIDFAIAYGIYVVKEKKGEHKS